MGITEAGQFTGRERAGKRMAAHGTEAALCWIESRSPLRLHFRFPAPPTRCRPAGDRDRPDSAKRRFSFQSRPLVKDAGFREKLYRAAAVRLGRVEQVMTGRDSHERYAGSTRNKRKSGATSHRLQQAIADPWRFSATSPRPRPRLSSLVATPSRKKSATPPSPSVRTALRRRNISSIAF